MNRFVYVLSIVTFLAAVIGCRPDPRVQAEEDAEQSTREKTDDVFVFPDAVRSDDRAVNALIGEAMRCCARGDYEGFRLLWSAKEEPLTRDEYEQGFKAVKKIEIRALQKVLIADEKASNPSEGETVYVSLADVDLDPDHRASKGESHREVVLLVRREEGKWRLAHAPKAVRVWLKKRMAEAGDESLPQVPANKSATND